MGARSTSSSARPATIRSNGTADDDLMLGLGGNDVLNGGDGNDILVGGPNGTASGGTFLDDFGGACASYTDNNGTLSNFTVVGSRSGGETPTSPTAGDININGSRSASSRVMEASTAAKPSRALPI